MKVTPVRNRLESNLCCVQKKQISNNQNHTYTPQNFAKANVLNFQAYQPKLSFGLRIGAFKELAATETHPLWDKLIAREVPFAKSLGDFRSNFEIDCDRIIHSGAYNRMRGKTQVFSNPENDEVSTRFSHTEDVLSPACQVAKFFGLNVDLTKAITKGHDIGHTPFGHEGERKLSEISERENLGKFRHSKNSIRVLDDLETEHSPDGKLVNLNLTYAVRDGVLAHSGDIPQNGLKPRSAYLDLRTVTQKIHPFTMEGCVVKVCDNIAWLGKDPQDAVMLGALDPRKLGDLQEEIRVKAGLAFDTINNSNMLKYLINDLCTHSSPDYGLKFSQRASDLMQVMTDFNYREIYDVKNAIQNPYTDLIMETLYGHLNSLYKGKDTVKQLEKMAETQRHPGLSKDFRNWLIKYSDINAERTPKEANRIVYHMDDPQDYKRSVIEFISTMTDKSAVDAFNFIIFPY